MDLAVILEELRSCGVDTAEEQLLLRQRAKAAEHPILLVAGDEPGRPLDLLEGLGIPPVAPDGSPVPFPVQCVYGEYQLIVTDANGEKHHYYDLASFQTHCGVEIAFLTIAAEAPVLRNMDFRFVTVNERTASRLPELAGDCSGILLVLDSTAGAPEPAVGTLCQWLKGTSGMGENICLLLNHTEKGATNWMLEAVLDVEPLDTLSSDYQAQAGSEGTPRAALEAAAEILSGAGAGGSADGMAAQCVERAGRKLEARMEELERAAREKDAASQWFLDNSRDYRAKMQMAGAAMSISLAPSQKEDLYADIKGLKEQLVKALPGMCTELVEHNGKQAKEDMKNLAGVYVEALCNSYMEFVTQQIADRILFKQAEKAFRIAEDGYRSLVDQAPIPVEEWAGGQDAELLKSVQFNLGDFQDPISRIVSAAVSFVVRTGIKLVSRKIFGSGGILLNEYIDKLGSAAGEGTRHFIKGVLPPQYYVDMCRQDIEKKLDDVPDMMLETLDGTVLPQINENMANLFQNRVDDRCTLLEKQGSVQKQEAEAIRAQWAALAEKRRDLAALT